MYPSLRQIRLIILKTSFVGICALRSDQVMVGLVTAISSFGAMIPLYVC